MVTPKDDSLSKKYKFYLRINVQGGFSKYVGPYGLSIGCPEITIADSPNLKTEFAVDVGQ